MDRFVACAPLRKRFAFVAGNDAPVTWLLRCSIAFRRPLLTGNGLWAAFSVLVRLAYKGFGTALLTHVPHDVIGRRNA